MIAADPAAQGAVRHHCFKVAGRLAPLSPPRLPETGAAHALAGLLPLLGCGEEAAVAGFDQLSRAGALGQAARARLLDIASDERQHDAMLTGLRDALPRHAPEPGLQRRARRFHLDLSRGGTLLHLARIAALDAAVCTLLSRLLRSQCSILANPSVTGVLRRIRRDEVRHVMVSRDLALAAQDRRAVRAAAAEARNGLAALLACGADHFEMLGVDPECLLRDIAHLPDGLLPQ